MFEEHSVRGNTCSRTRVRAPLCLKRSRQGVQTATDPGLVLGKGEVSGSRVAPSRSDVQNMCSGWCLVVFGTVFENVSSFGRTAVPVDM